MKKDRAPTVDEKPTDDVDQDDQNFESGSSEMYNSRSRSSEEDGGYRRPRGLKSVKWRKVLGLKPSRPQRRTYYDGRYEATPSIQQRTMVLEQTSSLDRMTHVWYKKSVGKKPKSV